MNNIYIKTEEKIKICKFYFDRQTFYFVSFFIFFNYFNFFIAFDSYFFKCIWLSPSLCSIDKRLKFKHKISFNLSHMCT